MVTFAQGAANLSVIQEDTNDLGGLEHQPSTVGVNLKTIDIAQMNEDQTADDGLEF
jgi:hypothetical protein